MIEHLVVSTIVLAALMIAARLLPVIARTRHAMLLCGLAKFAIPSTLFTTIGVRTLNVLPTPALLAGIANGPASAAAPRTNWFLIVWAAAATLLFARWLLLRTRTIAAALRSPAPPSQRELDALRDVQSLLGIRTAVDLLRSPLCEAPAVLRVIRPVILLPARGCDDLTDDELKTLLLHELSHVARRDNLISTFVALAASALWFHPLVWLAVRQLDTAREQACDERVAESMSETGAYLDALIKVCRAALAPRTAGASCMAGANVKERMEHLMNYQSLKRRAWSHRGLVAMSLIAIVATAAFAVDTPFKNQNLYSLRFNITPQDGRVSFDVSVIDNATGAVVTNQRVKADLGEWATATSDVGKRSITVQMRMSKGQPAELFLLVKENGQLVQRNLYTWDPQPVAPAAKEPFSGEPISLNLKEADIRDVMRTFASITGLTIEVAPEVTGTITMNVTGVPWDKALIDAAWQVGAKAVVEGKTIRITK